MLQFPSLHGQLLSSLFRRFRRFVGGSGVLQQFPSFTGGELRQCEPVVGTTVAGVAAQDFRIFRLVRRFGNGTAVSLTFQMQSHPAVHRFPHFAVVIVRRFKHRVTYVLRTTIQFEHGPDLNQRLLRFAYRKLKRISCGTDNHQCSRCGQSQNTPLLRKRQGTGNNFTHAAGGVQIRLVIADRTDRHDGSKSFVPCSGIHGLISAAAGSGDPQSVAVDFRTSQQVINGALVFIDLQTTQRPSRRQQSGCRHFPVIFAQSFLQSAFTGTEGIDGQHKESQFGQSDAAGLYFRLLLGSRLAKSARETPVIIAAAPEADAEHRAALAALGVQFLGADIAEGRIALPEMLEDLAGRGVSTLMVEGGATVAEQFLRDGMVDRIALFSSDVEVGQGGIASPLTSDNLPSEFRLVREGRFGDDRYAEWTRER